MFENAKKNIQEKIIPGKNKGTSAIALQEVFNSVLDDTQKAMIIAGGGLYTETLLPTTTVPAIENLVLLVTIPGTYTNFGNVVLPTDHFGFIFKNGNTFSLQSIKMPMPSIKGAIASGQTTEAVNGDTIYKEVKLIDIAKKSVGENKFDKSKVTANTLINATGVIEAYTGWSTSEKIPVIPNTNYTYYDGIIAVFDSNNTLLIRQSFDKNIIFTPSNASYAYYSTGSESINVAQLEIGTSATNYEEYKTTPTLDVDKIESNSILLTKLEQGILKGERSSRNLANYRTFKDGFYISEANGKEISNGGFTVSPFISIKPDTFYIQPLGNRVAFYSSADETTFISGLPPIGTAFKSPATAYYIKVCTPLTIKLTYQLEEGSTATAYEDYLTYKLPKEKVIGWNSNATEIKTEIPEISTTLKDYAPEFYKKWALRNSDVTVVLNGESISTTNYYAVPYADSKNRPPLMTEKNYTTFIEEALRWEGQKYFRFDNVGIFTEVGTATTKDYDLAWDWTRSVESELPAVNNRPAITRILTGDNCSVSYIIPTTAKRCDFIFRTDYLNANNAVVNISAGNGKVQVFNETTSAWVEANGFSYSAKEDGILLPGSLYKSMYQKRLKMKKVNINDADIRVTITNNGSGRLTYWGYQTSVADVMFDFILSARGGHSIPRLANFEAWDTDYYKPQLILWQVPIINEGLDVANADFSPKTMTKTKEQYAKVITDKYTAYKNKSYTPEILSYMLWIGKANNAINPNNEWVFGNDPNGNKVSAPTYVYHSIGAMESLNQNVIDLFSLIYKYSLADAKNKASNIIGVNLTASGMYGKTFTIDGVHYNTNGNDVVYKMFGNFFK